MKHKHNFQFVKEIPTYPIYKILDMKEVWNMEKKCIGWNRPKCKFVCICGKVKLVDEKEEIK